MERTQGAVINQDPELAKLDFKDQSAVMQERQRDARLKREAAARWQYKYNQWKAAQRKKWLENNWDLGL